MQYEELVTTVWKKAQLKNVDIKFIAKYVIAGFRGDLWHTYVFYCVDQNDKVTVLIQWYRL